MRDALFMGIPMTHINIFAATLPMAWTQMYRNTSLRVFRS